MNKILNVFLLCLCILLCSCNSGRKESRESEPNEEINRQEEQEKDEDERQYPEVVDITGESRHLKLGEVDVEDVGYEFGSFSFASGYSQVLDGHYYYLRTDGDGNYTVYRDMGEKVVCFAVGTDCYVGNFVKYGEKFYAFLMEDERQGYSDLANTLVSIDVGTGKVAVVKNMTEDTAENGLRGAVIYRDFLYYEDYSDYYEEYDFWENSYYTKPEVGRGRLARISLNEGLKEMSFPLSSRIRSMKENPLLTFIDGKVYYGEQQNKEVVLFSYDLENSVEKEIFRYVTSSTWEFNIKMDKDYLYSQDCFMIPREGGTMVPMSEGIYSWVLSPDGKYMFYLDKKDRIHRINRKKHKDIVICNDIPAIDGIDCTEDGIYVREYNKAEDEWEEKEYWDDWGDPRSNNLYYMDFDGKNRKRIWKEITEENGDYFAE